MSWLRSSASVQVVDSIVVFLVYMYLISSFILKADALFCVNLEAGESHLFLIHNIY